MKRTEFLFVALATIFVALSPVYFLYNGKDFAAEFDGPSISSAVFLAGAFLFQLRTLLLLRIEYRLAGIPRPSANLPLTAAGLLAVALLLVKGEWQGDVDGKGLQPDSPKWQVTLGNRGPVELKAGNRIRNDLPLLFGLGALLTAVRVNQLSTELFEHRRVK